MPLDTAIFNRPADGGHIRPLNRGLRVFFSEFVRASLHRPGQALFFVRTALWQRKAARVRARWLRQGVPVPPIAIFSITNRCNLHCKGCYAQAIRGDAPDALEAGELRRIVAEAGELGISFFVIAGGEPLTRPEILGITREFPRIVFLLVTNGLLLDEAVLARLAEQRNTIPVLSLEGNRAETDGRRGRGVFERLQGKMKELKSRGLFFSLSLTVSRLNFDTVTETRFIAESIRAGCRFFLFLEYTPIREGTDGWALTDDQRNRMRSRVQDFRRRFPAVFIAVPWDEEEVGGCLAAGRGFVHINADGDLEPCPFAPWSDANLKRLPLKEALQSRFLAALRENHSGLEDLEGGCSLWKNRERVRELLDAGPPGTG